MRQYIAFAFSLAALAVLCSGPMAYAQQTGDQQGCINALNKDGAKVLKTQSKEGSKCQKILAVGKTTSATTCISLDANQKVSKAKGKTVSNEAKNCIGGLATPGFGPGSSVALGAVNANDVATSEALALIKDLFGADLDNATVTNTQDKSGAKCQQGVLKAVQKCVDARLKVFNKDSKVGIRGGLIGSEAKLTTDCTMTGGDPATGQPDPTQKIQKKCVGRSKGIDKATAKKCAAKGIALGATMDALFPGVSAGVSDDELGRIAACQACRWMVGTDGLTRDCDLFDDGLTNGSCGGAAAVCGDNNVNQANEVCDGTDDSACPGLCLPNCTCPPDPVCGDNDVNQANEVCDGTDDSACPGLCLPNCTCPPDPVCGDNNVNQANEVCDGTDDNACPGLCLPNCLCTPDPVCGDNNVNQANEVCDGTDDSACPGLCLPNCTCPPDPVCGDNNVNQASEVCDGTDDSACPGLCLPNCTCPPDPVCGDNNVNQASEVCDGTDDNACPGLCLPNCLCPPDPVCGDNNVNQANEVCDGTDDSACPGLCLPNCTCPPDPVCGDNNVNQANEVCDGTDDSACPGLCLTNCTCPPDPVCGDNNVNQASEVCDGTDDSACPGLCLTNCTCPPEWTCDPSYYGTSDGCDCGCGMVDPDCADATVESCDFCGGVGSGSCDSVGDCSGIDPTNNAVCLANVCGNNTVDQANEVCDGTDDDACAGGVCLPDCTCIVVPPEWTCNPYYYGTSDGCDCGCGMVDPDCADATVESCVFCGLLGSCASVGDCSGIDPTNNAVCLANVCGNNTVDQANEMCDGSDDDACPYQCLPDCTCIVVPPEWTCGPYSYGDSYFCNCGCGVVDPDCADATVESCVFCGDFGSCDSVGDCSVIDPANNAGCLANVCGNNTVDQANEMCDGTDDDACAWAVCLPDCTCTVVPPEWTCGPYSYGDSYSCDCGCGVVDPDCADATVESCTYCADYGSCDSIGDCSGIDLTNNAVCLANVCGNSTVDQANEVCDGIDDDACAGAVCLPDCTCTVVPPEWTCGPYSYGDSYSCECGCGVVDPDCADATVESCTYCGDFGSCDSVGDCSGIDPANNAVCLANDCVPDCGGKNCGDDGCGGSCGTCELGEYCAGDTCTTGPSGWCPTDGSDTACIAYRDNPDCLACYPLNYSYGGYCWSQSGIVGCADPSGNINCAVEINQHDCGPVCCP